MQQHVSSDAATYAAARLCLAATTLWAPGSVTASGSLAGKVPRRASSSISSRCNSSSCCSVKFGAGKPLRCSAFAVSFITSPPSNWMREARRKLQSYNRKPRRRYSYVENDFESCRAFWWSRWDSNPRPSRFTGTRSPTAIKASGGFTLKNAYLEGSYSFGGADGIRTHGLLDAIEARSQLRHGPTG